DVEGENVALCQPLSVRLGELIVFRQYFLLQRDGLGRRQVLLVVVMVMLVLVVVVPVRVVVMVVVTGERDDRAVVAASAGSAHVNSLPSRESSDPAPRAPRHRHCHTGKAGSGRTSQTRGRTFGTVPNPAGCPGPGSPRRRRCLRWPTRSRTPSRREQPHTTRRLGPGRCAHVDRQRVRTPFRPRSGRSPSRACLPSPGAPTIGRRPAGHNEASPERPSLMLTIVQWTRRR